MCGMNNTTGSGDGKVMRKQTELERLEATAAKMKELELALSAALRREEVLREALKRVKGIISPYSVANYHIDDALSACDEGRK